MIVISPDERKIFRWFSFIGIYIYSSKHNLEILQMLYCIQVISMILHAHNDNDNTTNNQTITVHAENNDDDDDDNERKFKIKIFSFFFIRYSAETS